MTRISPTVDEDDAVNTRPDTKIAEEVLRLRLSQMIVNNRSKAGDFKSPIHLALGHEAIAVAVSAMMANDDWLLLTHRNIHYNLARHRPLREKIDEYLLNEAGTAGGQLGCMNLYNEDARILYTSSILGNQLAVTAGVALANRVKRASGLAVVVVGDGAIEEGVFQESLLMMKTFRTPALVVVENNQWSLATQIHERRCAMKLDLYAAALDIPYYNLHGNDPYRYTELLRKIRSRALEDETPILVEAIVHTLGDWRMKTEDYPDGKYINYHAGAAPSVELTDWPVIQQSDADPVHVLRKYYEDGSLKEMAGGVLRTLSEELS